MASQGPVLKLLPCLSKENCLHIGLSWRGIKGIIDSSHKCSYCGYFKVWSTYKVVVQMDIPGAHVQNLVLLCGSQSQCAHLWPQLQKWSFRQSCDPVTLVKGRNGSHSIVCKVTCCLLSLFLLHILFVFKCFRQSKNKCKSKDAVKQNAWYSLLHVSIKHSSKKKKIPCI